MIRARSVSPSIIALPCLLAWVVCLPGAGTASSTDSPAATDDGEASWDIEDVHGPGHAIRFTTQTGTWMSVDVHPDGKRFVFDLAGDLYELPLSGGTAKRLTTGAAWDAEPRYSPDGATVAFTSDRSNNNNIWLMDSDGGRPRALTTESAVRIRDAAWSPEGDYLVARKRMTDRSSIGTNELWLYHRLGGSGVQLTKKEEAAGVMEPAVSPDGRFVYFSLRPGRFAYNEDPNAGIWQIGRLDRTTGQMRPLTGEFGGAIRPTPSPDGETLAILRRVRAHTVLEIYDLASGARRPVADWLDRDGQESFGNNGLYPRMDWTPDGRILLTAQGRFWLVDVASGERTEIPFEAEIDAFIHDPVRPKRSPVHDTVRANLVRWPVVSPSGEELLFGALGGLWRMSLPDGEPTPLKVGAGVDADRTYCPAWSADGDFITFVSWDDAAGGAVWVMPARGPGKAKRVSILGPKFTNPSFSPDGKEIVVRRGSGSHLRGVDLGDELWSDVVILDVAGRTLQERIVTATTGLPGHARPRFSADGERILLPEAAPADPEGNSAGALVSVNRDGTDRKTLLNVAHATEIVPSPDGRWVAFQDGHHVWLGAVPSAGAAPATIGAGVAATPGWRLSEHSGEWVDFAQGGAAVTWGYGPQVHRLLIADVLGWEEARQEVARQEAERAKAEGDDDDSAGDDDDSAAEEPEIPPSDRFDIVLERPRAVPHGLTAYTGARVITMKGDEILEGATVLVRDDRIEAVGADVIVPPDAHVVDASGTTIVPGFIDVHSHMHFSALDVLPAQHWQYLANLAYGVTTAHDPSAFSDNVFAFGELVETGQMWGPRIFSTGEILYGAGGSFRSDVQTREDARRHLLRMKQLGAISVKTYQQPRRDQRQWIVEEGRKEGMLVVPEGGGDLFNNFTMVLDGHTSIEHALPVAPLHEDLLTIFAESGLGYSPTLLVTYGGPMGENWFFNREPVWAKEKLQRFTPQAVLDPRARRSGLSAPEDEWYHRDIAAAAAAIVRKGGLVTLGAHGQLQGLGAHWELWALASEGAMTPMEALHAATISGATYLGMEADLGSIEAGKLADFLILDKDPLADIENTDSLRHVIKNGELFDANTMDRLWPDPAPKPVTSFERAEGR